MSLTRLEHLGDCYHALCHDGKRYLLEPSDTLCMGSFDTVIQCGRDTVSFSNHGARINYGDFNITRITDDFALSQLRIEYVPESDAKCACYGCSGHGKAQYKVLIGHTPLLYCENTVYCNRKYFNLSTYAFWLWSIVTRDYGRDIRYSIIDCYIRWKRGF